MARLQTPPWNWAGWLPTLRRHWRRSLRRQRPLHRASRVERHSSACGRGRAHGGDEGVAASTAVALRAHPSAGMTLAAFSDATLHEHALTRPIVEPTHPP